MPHLALAKFYHRAMTFDDAVDSARVMVVAAQQPDLAARLHDATPERPFTIDATDESSKWAQTATLSLFQRDAGWYWQYEETRIPWPAIDR